RLAPLAPLSLHSCFPVPPPRPPSSTLFPYTTLFRSDRQSYAAQSRSSEVRPPHRQFARSPRALRPQVQPRQRSAHVLRRKHAARSEEHTSELQSRENLVCRLLLEKKKENQRHTKTDA